MNRQDYSKTLKVGVFLDQLAYPIDPANNPNLTNAFFSNNLYSNLIDIDENNNYQNELVSKYWFDQLEKKLYFEFENSRVNADDAAFSLKRLVFQNKQLHTDFWNIICEESESVFACSDRIYVENGRLVIKYFDESRSQYIIPTLASVDYKIVPRAAFDILDYKKAKINNHTITSGYYHLQIRDSKYIFVRNHGGIQNIYKEYELVNMNADTVLDENKSLRQQVDIISTTVVLKKNVLDQLIKMNWSIFRTHNISIHLLAFSENGLSKTTVAERFSFASRLVAESTKLVQLSNAKETVEFFQDYGQGFLNADQKSEIETLRHATPIKTSKNITYGTKFPEKWANFERENPDISIIKNEVFPVNMKREDQPDMFILSNDVSYDLNLSLISYAANIGLLDMSKKEVDTFSKLKNEKEKTSYMNSVHFKTLKECVIYPMWSSPYHTAFIGNFEHNLSQFNSRTLLWKIH